MCEMCIVYDIVQQSLGAMIIARSLIARLISRYRIIVMNLFSNSNSNTK